jgi:ribonuclease-3
MKNTLGIRYKELEKKIKIIFKDKELIDRAFVHKSYLNEYKNKDIESNERLEFLGDAVLELVVTEFLFKTYPHKDEGILTNWRSALVKGQNLAKISKKLDLGQYLYLSKGEERSDGRKKNYILGNTVEAVIGAIYLDQGYIKAHKFIDNFILKNLEEILEKGLHIDAKSNFQELSQEYTGVTPDYELVSEKGPDHNKKFIMAVLLNGKKLGKGKGPSKQKAAENAARDALIKADWEKLKKEYAHEDVKSS